MADPQKLKRSVRIGCFRRQQFRPLASLVITGDGGIALSPADHPGFTWKYAVSKAAENGWESIDIARTDRPPKLHYHRSGYASVSLTGHDLERRSMHLESLEKVGSVQILSLVAIRPWQFPLREARKGDVGTVHNRWPGDVAWMFQLVKYRRPIPELPVATGLTGPLRMLTFDDSRFLVDMRAYIPDTVLVALSACHTAPSAFREPSITVAALPWSHDRSDSSNNGVLALWSSSRRNPLVAHSRPSDLLTEETLSRGLQQGPFNVETIDEQTDRLFGPRQRHRLPDGATLP